MAAPLWRLRRRFSTQPLRTCLTVLQLALGAIAIMVALSAYLGSLEDYTAERFLLTAGNEEAGVWNVMVAAKIPELLSLAPAVQDLALFGDAVTNRLRYDGEMYEVSRTLRVMPDFFDIAGIELTRGSFFTREEFEAGARVALVSESVAKDLFAGANPISQEFTLVANGREARYVPKQPYKVIGTFAYKLADRDVIGLRSVLGHIYIPMGFGDRVGEHGSYLVRAKPGQGKLAREQILAAANIAYRDWQGIRLLREGHRFYIEDLGHRRYIKPDESTIVSFGLFGIIALMIGTIGAFSSTAVDVAEKSHEIGVRRSLGASRTRIAVEFMGEAGLMAVVGGVIGVGLSAAVLPMLAPQSLHDLFSGIRLRFDPLVGIGVLALVVVLSALLGMLPALQATRLQPVEALRDA